MYRSLVVFVPPSVTTAFDRVRSSLVLRKWYILPPDPPSQNDTWRVARLKHIRLMSEATIATGREGKSKLNLPGFILWALTLHLILDPALHLIIVFVACHRFSTTRDLMGNLMRLH